MTEYLTFVSNNWALSFLFILILAWIVYIERQSMLGGLMWCGPQQLIALMNRDKAWVVDVRSLEQFKTGHILGARSYPQDRLQDQMKSLKRQTARSLVLVCQNGQQSVKVGAILKKEGFEKIHALKGGLQAWKTDNMPLVVE